jgi:cytochrome c553
MTRWFRSTTARLLLGTALATSAPLAFGQSAAATLHLRALAATCANCHGTDGRAVAGAAMVALAGRPKADIVTPLRAFRDGTRPATVMHQLVKGYTDEQIDAIAGYFASRK